MDLRTDQQAMIRALSPFGPLPAAAQEALLLLFSPRTLHKHERFADAGTLNTDIGFVVNGVMRAFFRHPNGTEYNKSFFVENDFALSLASVLTRTPGYLTFEALTDVTLLTADYDQVMALFAPWREIETIARKFIEYEWVVQKEQRELRLVVNTAEERYRHFQQEYPDLENRIPQYHIASHLGITPVQLSRIRARRKG